ncbi:hypothetical protein EV175_002635, partial [Coemansia sp. RSA 1933]
ENVKDEASGNVSLRFKPRFVSLAVCESLLDAISKIRIDEDTKLIDQMAVVALYDYAAAHEWEIDRIVLTDSAVYLARVLYIELSQHIRQNLTGSTDQLACIASVETLDVPISNALGVLADQTRFQNSSGGFDIAASTLAVDKAMGVLRKLSCSQDQTISEKLCTHMIRLLCAYDRESDAEWALSLAKMSHGKYTGTNIGAMMAMYYRKGNASRADALFNEFNDLCERIFGQIRNVTVMPDSVGVQVERWQLKNEKGIENPSVISTIELSKFRNRHSAPFFRKALEHVYRKETDKAVACIQGARYQGYAVLGSEWLDTLIINMVRHGCLRDAFGVFTSFRSGVNATSGTGIAAYQVISSDLPSHRGVAVLLSEFSRVSDWNCVWQIIKSVKDAPGNLMRIGTVQALLRTALGSKDWPQAIRLANSIAALVFRDGDEFRGFSSDYMRGLFDCLVRNKTMSLSGERHLLTEVVETLLHKNALAMGSVYMEWNSSILHCALDSINASTSIEPLRLWSELCNVVSRHNLLKQQPVCLAITDAAVNLLDSVPGEYCAVPVTRAQIADNGWSGFIFSPGPGEYENKMHDSAWMTDIYTTTDEHLWECLLDVFTRSAQQQYPKNLLKYILLVFKFAFFSQSPLNNHVSISSRYSGDIAAIRQKLADAVWSQAISQYAALDEIEEATDYFRRIVGLGGYPVSHATADFLTALVTSKLPLPVLPKDWNGDNCKVFRMEPAYPPQGDSSADLFIVPSSLDERNRIVAEIGLAMLYSMLRREIWPTTYFYCVLFSVLGKAKMDAPLKHIFSYVMPSAMRAMPAKLRINPAFMPSPVVWTMAIKAAIGCGCRPLAEFWIKEYRMSAMPIFRDDASAYSRFAHPGQPYYARLFVLASPYYLIFSSKQQWHESDSVSRFVYDLREVEEQLELDRLRALDKLPIGFMESATMLTIYALVDEHRNMASAEILAEEIFALYKDTNLPKRSRPRGYDDLTFCWRMMVIGYINELRKLEARLLVDDTEPYAIKMSETRLHHWFEQWKYAFKKSKMDTNRRKNSELVLSDEEFRMAECISRRRTSK